MISYFTSCCNLKKKLKPMRFTENFVIATSKLSPCFCWPININGSLIQLCIDKRRPTTSMMQIEGIDIWNAKNDLSFNCSFQHPLDRARCAHRTISMVYPLFWWWCFSCSSFVKLCIFCVCVANSDLMASTKLPANAWYNSDWSTDKGSWIEKTLDT